MNNFKTKLDEIKMNDDDKKRVLNKILEEKDKKKINIRSYVVRFACILLVFALLSTTAYAAVKIFVIDKKISTTLGKSGEELKELGVGGTDVSKEYKFDNATFIINQTVVEYREVYISVDIIGKDKPIYVEDFGLMRGDFFNEELINQVGSVTCENGNIYSCSSSGCDMLEIDGNKIGYTFDFSIDGEVKEVDTVTMRIKSKDGDIYDLTFDLEKNDIKTKSQEFDTVVYNENDIEIKVKKIIIDPLYVSFKMEYNVDFDSITEEELEHIGIVLYNDDNSNNNTYVTFKDGTKTFLRLWNGHTKRSMLNPYGIHGEKEEQINDIDNIESVTLNGVKLMIN